MAITIRYAADTRSAERNVRRVNREVQRSTGASQMAGRTFGRLGPIIAAAFSVMVIRRFTAAITDTSDTVTNIGNQLRSAGVSSEQIGTNLRAVADLSRQTRASLEATGGLYARILRSTRELGLSQQQALTVTQSFQESLALSGASTQEAAAASLQFGQALASGRLAGDELRSILENNSFFAQSLANRLGVGVGALRDMGAAGELTSATLAQVALDIAPSINEQFSQLTPTFGQLATVINNEVVEALSDVGAAILNSSDDAQALAERIGQGIGTFIRSSLTVVRTFGDAVFTVFATLIQAANTFWTAISTGGQSAILGMQNLLATFANFFVNTFNSIVNFFVERLNTIVRAINTTAEQLSRLPGVDITQLAEIGEVRLASDFQDGLQRVLAENSAEQQSLSADRAEAFASLERTWDTGVGLITDTLNSTLQSRFAESGAVSTIRPGTPSTGTPSAASAIADAAAEPVTQVTDAIKSRLVASERTIGAASTRFADVLTGTLSSALRTGNFSGIGKSLLGNLLDSFGGDAFQNGLKGLSNSLSEGFSGLFKNLASSLSGLFGGSGGIGGLFSGLFSSVRNLFNGGGGLGGLFQGGNGSNLLGFATGGVVPGPVGSPQLALVHGGERVLTPEHQRMTRGAQGDRGVVLNLTFNTTGNVDEATQRALRSSSNQISRSVETYLIERGIISS